MTPPPISPTDKRTWSDELALVRRARGGDSLAFDELVRRFRPRLVHWLRQRTGSWADAEDVAQAALVRAFERIDQHDQRRPFSVWAVPRSPGGWPSTRSAERGPRAGLDAGSFADARAAEPEQSAMASELRDNLWSIARRVLGDSQYSALWLRYAEEMSVEDVAAVLGRTRLSTRVLLHRARRRLAPHVVALAEPGTANGRTPLGEMP